MQNNNVIATEVAEKPKTNGKARFTAYMQGMKKLERKAHFISCPVCYIRETHL